MAGIIFIIIVLLMAVACVAILLHGRPMVLVDPNPSYVIVEDEEPEERTRSVWYYPPRDRPDPDQASVLYQTWQETRR